MKDFYKKKKKTADLGEMLYLQVSEKISFYFKYGENSTGNFMADCYEFAVAIF